MSKKEIFIKEIEEKIKYYGDYLSKDAMDYFESLKVSKSKEGLTENGKKVLKYMQDSNENVFDSKKIGEGIGISARSVSGSMRKLISEGYVNKINSNPVSYEITDLGKSYNID